eukprot:1378739-Amorphochlora_amoeboformis.AAC.1
MRQDVSSAGNIKEGGGVTWGRKTPLECKGSKLEPTPYTSEKQVVPHAQILVAPSTSHSPLNTSSHPFQLLSLTF